MSHISLAYPLRKECHIGFNSTQCAEEVAYYYYYYKKDGYRQQNVRQRQKLISIIDYDVCMTFY